jgi:CHRD domain
MSGYLEGAPGGPVSSAASGSFEASIDDAASEIDFTLTFADLEAPVLFAHIHFGQRSVNGGVAAFLCGGGGKPACPQSGTVTGTIVPADVVGPTGQGIAAGEFGELVAAIRAGRTYANVHSTKFPGGEVRGQINDDNQRDD